MECEEGVDGVCGGCGWSVRRVWMECEEGVDGV